MTFSINIANIIY